MPNVAFWTYTRKLAGFQPPTRFTNGALATAKQQGPEGRTGPAGNSPQCLTLLSEPTRKLAVAVSSRQQGSQTAPSPQRNSRAMRDGPGLRATAPSAWPAGNSRHCLTLLSEPSRKLAVFQLPTRLTNGALATANQQRPEGRTEPCGSCLPAATKEAHKRRPRHSETAGPWSTDRACGQWPPVPNVAFWTYKKTSCLPAAKEAHKRRPRHSETAGPWSTDRACGQRPPVPNEPTRKLAVFQPPRKLTNGALATAKLQGPEGRTGPASNGPQCLTLLSEPTRKLAVFQPPTRLTNGALATAKQLAVFQPPTRLTNGALATAKQQGPDGRTGPAGNGPQCLTLLSEPTRKLAVIQPPTRLTNGALATAKQQGPDGRTGPAGNGLTMLSEPSRKLAVFQPPRTLTNGTLATAKQQGPEGRTGPVGNGPQCLTLLSEPMRKLAVAVFQPPTRLTNGALATAKKNS